MKSKIVERARVIENIPLTVDVYSMILETKISDLAKPGQFVALYSDSDAKILPRPISICDFSDGRIRLVYRVVGEGTYEFSNLKEGDTIKVMGPLGNGYPIENLNSDSKVTLVGGGVGVPPLLALAKTLSNNGIKNINCVLGFRNEDDIFLEDDFEEYSNVTITTDDGSAGFHGNTVSFLQTVEGKSDVIYSCGPKIMLHFLKEYTNEKGIKLFVSLEEKMACGIGACLACVCKSKNVDNHSKVHNKRVCKDGPVFDAEEVEL